MRSDIRASFLNGSTATPVTEAPVPIDFTITLVNYNANCAPLVGYAIYIWHVNQKGAYSYYPTRVDANESYNRGMQVTDANGQVHFKIYYPLSAEGLYPFVGFEVFPSLAAATHGSNAIFNSQMSFDYNLLTNIFDENSYTVRFSTWTNQFRPHTPAEREQETIKLTRVGSPRATGLTGGITVPITLP
ncbi:hypothetical protein CVN68_21835 [Sphingomonas psychrotolerans]|uniref:Uncharacterized protein n=1 Tax=Sphingomonas psychrotolerans TaxID=1327635 RepID=A0A2K8MS11_9SPHN|nr:hypothetical protein CVN68_21835 [Sphingomonas psychrotolerans]